MGKKKGKDKKGKGAEKTALKTEKNTEKKTKKMLKKKGEEDIETLIAQFQEEDRKKQVKPQYVETKCDAPSARCNMSFTPHPERDELLIFGGEFFNGSKTFMYNDLFSYNIKTGDWLEMKSPIAPPPRCGHQAVAVHHGGGQLWVFGGEFASPTQSQFYHYKDLWFFSLRDKVWKKVNASGGPSSRSGHRMAAYKKLILIFGGFHDNTRDYRYFNDVHGFNVETLQWVKLDISGSPPAPRSACMVASNQSSGQLLVYGGYSKERIKKDVDRGKTHTDMFSLSPITKGKSANQDTEPVTSWKWMSVKQSGARPSPRCGCTMVVTPGNRAIVFGGVLDEEENEEELKGTFYNDMYNLELDHGRWHHVQIRGKSKVSERRKRRRKKSQSCKDGGEGEISSGDSDSTEEDMEEEVKKLKVTEESVASTVMTSSGDDVFKVKIGPQRGTVDDSIFTVTVHPSSSSSGVAAMDVEDVDTSHERLFVPCGRMNTLLAVKNSMLYLYGGMLEDGDKQITLSDFYSLDLHKLDEWKVLIQNDITKMEWIESDSSEDEDHSGSDEEADGGSDDDMEDSDDEMDFEEEPPEVASGESYEDFFQRNEEYWISEAKALASSEGIQVTDKKAHKAAKKMAEEYYTKSTNKS